MDKMFGNIKPEENIWHFTVDIFKCIILEMKLIVFDSVYNKTKVCSSESNWCRTGDQTIPEPMMTQFTNEYQPVTC